MALSGAFKLFDASNDVVKNIKSTISSGIWSGGSGTLAAYYTQSAQSSSLGDYYYDIYKTSPLTDSEAEVQFSITYGHLEGSGSLGTVGAATGNRATAAIHAQLVNLLLGPNVDRFTYAGDTTSKEFYAISLKRSRMREKVDPGNWELWLDGGANLVKLIDDSKATTNPSSGVGGRVFNVVSGSIQTGTAVTKTAAASQAGGGIGLFYPDVGLIVLNADQMDSLVADITTVTTSNTVGANVPRFFDSIVQGAKFQARREERLSSTHFFCRAGNKEFNFSNNPTFFTASDGTFTQPTFFKDPKTYITTIGLYNDSNELLAVAKLSQPVLKSYSREALIKVKLDF
ncbi:MAG: hypothetical protein NZ811_05195 [Gammaproteobacteria bacterium]|jgi:hypothetical protein|nr:hypothetical protein [Gammaproteobacteria bacterium]